MNQTVGLLRVLAPDIFGLVAATIVIAVIALIAWRVTRALSDTPNKDIKLITTGLRWLWYVIVIAFLWHALTVTWSLRIPRSDVDATGVYQRMNDATQGTRL